MKKIGIYDPYLDDCGGGEKYMMTIASILSSKYSVDVFWDNPADFEAVVQRFSINTSEISIVPNIFSPHVSTLQRLKKTKKYDGIVFLSDGSIPIISCKLFIHVQRPLTHLKLSLLDRLKLARVESIFCNSEFTKKYIDKSFHTSTRVLYPPVALHPKKVKKENIVLHVGRFRVMDKTVGVKDFKKQYMMVGAFRKMVDQGLSGWKLVMAVSLKPEDKKEFQKLLDLAIGYPIEFKVNLSNKDLWEFYSKAKIYWHASGFQEDLGKNPEYAEHFGISTVEAMGAGAVPVVINAGGQTEIVTDGVNGMLWSTLPELIELTLILINSKEELGDLSKNALKRAEYFSETNFKKHLEEIIIV